VSSQVPARAIIGIESTALNTFTSIIGAVAVPGKAIEKVLI